MAADKFEYQAGKFHFATPVFARRSPARYRHQARKFIRYPVHMIETINKMNRLSRQKYLQEFGLSRMLCVAEKMEILEDKIRKTAEDRGKSWISMETPIATTRTPHLRLHRGRANNAPPLEAAIARSK
jgi:RNA polymerase primary sigma factor